MPMHRASKRQNECVEKPAMKVDVTPSLPDYLLLVESIYLEIHISLLGTLFRML